ncbi:hypothetical protein [Selenomonas sp. FC4001]|uniref:hypothetical protein n=1 Tax=Selenomonas sp. FC4001 TaxID=1408313 RepID=UPI00055DD1DB|nr:hypothetical protein [Selenomonas sp. FC4001]
MATMIINGKQVYIPKSEVTTEDIIQAGSRPGTNPKTRTAIHMKTGQNTKLKPGHLYHVNDGAKIQIVPDRVKASEFSYFGEKEEWQKAVIRSQVQDVCQKFFKKNCAELDENCNWVVFDGFLLPEAWRQANPGQTFVRLMLIFPDQYPDLPTNGFYLPATLQVPHNATHFYNRGYGGAFGEQPEEIMFMSMGNWKWYCTHIKPGAWQPAYLRKVEDWRYGDNLWDILTLCTDVLTYPFED